MLRELFKTMIRSLLFWLALACALGLCVRGAFHLGYTRGSARAWACVEEHGGTYMIPKGWHRQVVP